MTIAKVSIFFATFFIAISSFAGQKSICGRDDRVSSYDSKVARSLHTFSSRSGCTITMIGDKCAISAGHCLKTFDYIQFDVPESTSLGDISHSTLENTYRVNKETIVYEDSGRGKDWAVMEILPHETTGLLAGAVNGFYDIAFDGLLEKDSVSITGYGYDGNDPEKNFTQQRHEDIVVRLEGSILKHTIDTQGGNSGSSVLRTSDDKIVAVHTHGGCSFKGNSSTYIKESQKLQDAIKACLNPKE